MFRLSIVIALALAPVSAFAAQDIPSHCIAMSRHVPGIVPVALKDGALAPDQVRLHFVGHATFLLESAAGVTVATDYAGYTGDVLPDVVTMNHAHSTHWTASPDPRIPHVLRGWGDGPDAPADHYLELRDLIIRNVPTDIRAFGGSEVNGNSIFVFEVAGLCIGHLGHLHHEPSEEQYAAIGRLDIVLAPVDGGYTLPLPDMIRILNRLKARWVIPMHWFGPGALEAFLTGIAPTFAIERRGGPEAVFALSTLPRTPTVLVLDPEMPFSGD